MFGYLSSCHWAALSTAKDINDVQQVLKISQNNHLQYEHQLKGVAFIYF